MRKTIHYGWLILVLGVLVVFCSLGLARFGYAPILPSMQKALNLTNTQTGTIATGNLTAYLLFALLGGFFVSHLGGRIVIPSALFLVGISSIMTGFSNGFRSVFIWRTITGIGSGCSNVPIMGIMSAWFAPKRRGLATGIAVTGSSIGLIVTGLLIPRILDAFGAEGWKYAWMILGAIVIFISALTATFLCNHPEKKGLFPIGTENNTSICKKMDSKPVVGISSVWRSGTVWYLGIIYFTFGFSYIIFTTFFSKYLQSEAHLTKESASNLWMTVGWISFSCGVIWGWVSDVLGRKYALLLVNILQGTAYMVFALWTEPIGIRLAVVLFGITAWSIPALMASACGDQLGAKLAPAALGFVTLFFGIGQAIGPAIAGKIADVTDSFSQAFIVAGIVAWIGGIGSLFLRKKPVIQ